MKEFFDSVTATEIFLYVGIWVVIGVVLFFAKFQDRKIRRMQGEADAELKRWLDEGR